MASTAAQVHTPCAERPGEFGGIEDYEFLLACLQRALLSERNCRARIHRVSWPRVLELAARHEVLPQLRSGLRGNSDVPPDIQESLDESVRTIVAHNLSLASELSKLLELFDRSGVTAVPFKGPAWTVALYGNLALRQIADLDIFIEKHEARRVLGLLKDLGYVLSPKLRATSANDIRLYRKDIELIKPGSDISLEVHWAACEPFFDRRLTNLKFWQPASTVNVLNHQMPLPSPEDVFLLLALHGLRHRWESLKWLCDITALMRTFPRLDWPTVLLRASKLSRMRMALLPLVMVHNLFGIELPACVEEAIAQRPAVPGMARRLQKRHYTPAGEFASSERAVRRLIDHESIRIRSKDSFLERFRRDCPNRR
jgi:hypothetical protein